MSLKLLDEVNALRIGDPIAKAILRYLAWRTNHKTGECYPSIDTIAFDVEFGKATVLRKLRWLEKHGHLRVQRPARPGRGIANQYDITIKKGSPAETLSEPRNPSGKSEKGSHIVAERVSQRPSKGAQGETPTKKKNKKELEGHAAERPPANRTSSDEPAPQTARTSVGRSSSLSMSGSRSADLPLGGERQPETPVPAVIAAALAEAKRSAGPKPARLDRPIITAEQRAENAASARLHEGLRQDGQEFYCAAIDRLDADLFDRAVAAEAIEPGAGVALVRSEMLNSPGKAATGNAVR